MIARLSRSGRTTSGGDAIATYSVKGSFQPLHANSEPEPSQPRTDGSQRGSRPGPSRPGRATANAATSAQVPQIPHSRRQVVRPSSGWARPAVPPAAQYSHISPTAAPSATAARPSGEGPPPRPLNASGQRLRR
ncbi:hypothetical protein SMF913_27836 [Streptomyces malaysiensis]|uniref:Uncharacterized protein n=1 Tax=Streptomyces malaysiensis TaxID=92644 RepID=A0A2J7YWH5_STRMQ|nr:hypothetical protein SMF913_27836 [Streptomyces malaysiensis]